jgi:hypothetical protein
MYANFWDLFLPELERMERIWSSPYTWNRKEERFSLIRRPSYVKRYRVLSVLIALHMPIVFWNLLQTLRNETNIILIIYAVGYTSVTSGITVIRWMYQNQIISGEIINLINLTVKFQKLSTRPGKIDGY